MSVSENLLKAAGKEKIKEVLKEDITSESTEVNYLEKTIEAISVNDFSKILQNIIDNIDQYPYLSEEENNSDDFWFSLWDFE